MTDDELTYLIGHEIGHIINHDAELGCLYDTYCDKLKYIFSVETILILFFLSVLMPYIYMPMLLMNMLYENN